MNLGLIPNEPADVYHGGGATSSSKLGDMRIAGKLCPRNYYVRHVSKAAPRKSGPHFDVGIASHIAILEGVGEYQRRVVREPAEYVNDKGETKPWNNNANVCKDWYRQQTGRTVLSNSEADLVDAMFEAVMQHPEARELVTHGHAEVTFRTQIAGLTLQCRTDKWHPTGIDGVAQFSGSGIVDLKTCDTLEQFERDFAALRYHFRAEFYRLVVSEVLAAMAGVPVTEIDAPWFAFVAVEKSAPHRVKVYTPDADSLAAGRKEVHADLIVLRQCIASGQWPTGCEGVHPIGLRTYQLQRSIEASEAALERAA